MIFTSKVDKIDMDDTFGKVTTNIKTMDSKFQTLVSDNISLIGSVLDDYIASYHTEIANLNSDTHITMRIDLETHGYFVKAITSINNFKLYCNKYGHDLEFSISGRYRVDVDYNELIDVYITPQDKADLKRRLERYFSKIPTVDNIDIWSNEITISLDTVDAKKKFESDMNKFLNVYFDKRKIKATVHGNEIQIYGFSNDE